MYESDLSVSPYHANDVTAGSAVLDTGLIAYVYTVETLRVECMIELGTVYRDYAAGLLAIVDVCSHIADDALRR